MAEFSEQPFHARSNSMPSTNHPTLVRVEDELHSLRTNLSSSSRTAKMMCDGLRGLGDLYELIEESLRLPSNQLSINSCQKRWVEMHLDDSLKMLDLIAAVKDCIVAMRERVQGFRSTLRRKGNSIVSTKEEEKLIKDCLKSLKRMAERYTVSKESDTFVQALTEARNHTIFLLQSILLFLQKPQQNGGRWLILSKAATKRRVSCDDATEVESAYTFLKASYDCMACKDVDAVQILNAQENLNSLEMRVESLDLGLDCLFRRQIQNRVSMLNLLSL